VFVGTSSTPLFTQFLPESSSVKWGTGSPPGGAGECLMQMNGVFFNGSCNSVGNYACEEKTLTAGVTTAMCETNYIFDKLMKKILRPPGGLLESLANGNVLINLEVALVLIFYMERCFELCRRKKHNCSERKSN
jgi:hypothetical protein